LDRVGERLLGISDGEFRKAITLVGKQELVIRHPREHAVVRHEITKISKCIVTFT
jgi:hypothetical protein